MSSLSRSRQVACDRWWPSHRARAESSPTWPSVLHAPVELVILECK
jgi:hypothetical protein